MKFNLILLFHFLEQNIHINRHSLNWDLIIVFVYIQSSKKHLILHPNFWPAFLLIFFFFWLTESFRSTPIYHWSKALQFSEMFYDFVYLLYSVV